VVCKQKQLSNLKSIRLFKILQFFPFNLQSTRLIIPQIFLIGLSFSILTSGAYAYGSLIYAGFSFVGNYSENQERYPYAAELATQTANNGMSILDHALREVVKSHYQRKETLIYSQRDIGTGTNLALAFGLSQESVEKVGWKDKNLYIYRVLSQVMIFDFSKKILLANFPAMIQYQEIDENIRDVEAHRIVFRHIYLDSNDTQKSIFCEWVMRLNSVAIKESYPFYLKVGSLDLDSELIEQLPNGTTSKAYSSEVVQLFESIFSKEQKVSMVPFTKGQAIGGKMPMRFSDATVLQLKLPEADYVIDIDLHGFKHLLKKSGQCHKHAFGAFATFNLSLPVSNKQYFNQRFKKVNFAVFSAADKVAVDVWHGQQTTLRSLFVCFSQQISKRDIKVLSQMVKEPKKIAKQLVNVEGVLSKCR